MSAERHRRLVELFHDACGLEASARTSFLDEACAGDAAMRRELEALLEVDDSSGAFLERPALGPDFHLAAAPQPERGADRASQDVPERIGPYRVREMLGEGGMGVVFRATQEEPVRRDVAIKIIRLGMDTRRVIARFEAERQALAIIDHPGIARVLDAGVMPTGRPYFVMDLVHGATITRFCAERGLGPDERVQLVARVCDVVQHAHQKGVIHRDLKPSNVLVAEIDGRPAPRVIDFGIARAVGEPLGGCTRQTLSGQLVGTPAYMSPEQATEPQRADTRSDVYSIGAILYELLTGAPPFDDDTLGGASQGEIERILREVEPARPSSRASAARGDLEAIILKAMEKVPERRYASVARLADDLRRHLAHEPVSARAPSLGYRLSRFVRRHRVGTAAAAVVVAVVLAAGALVTRSTLEARRAAAQTATINAFMGDVLTSASPDEHGADVRLVDVLDEAARGAPRYFDGYPELRALADELVGRVYDSLGKPYEARPLLASAYAGLREHFGDDDPRTLRAGRRLALNLIGIGALDEAGTLIESLRPLHRAAFGEASRETIELEILRLLLLGYRGRYDEAIAGMLELRERARWWLGPDDEQLGSIAIRAARLMHRRWAGTIGHDELLDAAIDLLEPLIPPPGDPAEGGRTAVNAMLTAAAVEESRGRLEEVETLCRRVIDVAVPRYGEHHGHTLRAMQLLAHALGRLGEADEGADWMVRAIEGGRINYGDEHLPVVITAFGSLPVFDRAGRDVDGHRYAWMAAERLAAFVGPDDGMVYQSRSAAAHFLSRMGETEEAGALFARIEAAYRGDWPPETRACHCLYYGRHLARVGDRAGAEAMLRESIAAFEAVGGGGTDRFAGVWDADAARAALADLRGE